MSTILKLIEWMKPNPSVLFSLALVMLTVLITVPVTVSIQSAKNVMATLDTVVISQHRLEKTLNSVFDGLDARLRVQDREIQKIKDVVVRTNDVHGSIFFDLSRNNPNHQLFEERLRNLRQYQDEKWGYLNLNAE